MRGTEPLKPDVAAALAAIDATLAGDPADPEYADLTELALILRDERPAPDLATATALDARVAGFGVRAPRRRPRVSLRWLAAPAAALAAVALAVVVVVVSAGGGGGISRSSTSSVHMSSAPAGSSASSASAGGAGTVRAPAQASASTTAAGTATALSGAPAAPSPPASGPGRRQVAQSARLSLSAAPQRIDDVAQQVFGVVDAENGIVRSSHVISTGGPDASAHFSLSVPVSHLQRTVSGLSRLHDAHVLSRTDDSADITARVGGAGARLAEARALRRSLLRRLAAATTSEAVAGLRAQLRDADAAIARAAATLTRLHRQVDYSSLTVDIVASAAPVTGPLHGGGFTLPRALHDAGRVLVVAAGVALIALAVLVPVGLVGALVAWAGLALRRRRREAMLDLM